MLSMSMAMNPECARMASSFRAENEPLTVTSGAVFLSLSRSALSGVDLTCKTMSCHLPVLTPSKKELSSMSMS